MDLSTIYTVLLISQFASSGVILIILTFVNAPYGKHSRKGWGQSIGSRAAWMLMELPAVFTIIIVYWLVTDSITTVPLVFLFLWETHYIYRTFLYSGAIRGSKRNLPLLLVVFAFLFNCINGFINGYFLGTRGSDLEASWFYSIPFITGTVIFLGGFFLHVRSDSIIRSLRMPGEKGYSIPQGGLFKYVTNPNYLGEIVDWWEWAVLTLSLPGPAFAVFTTANLLPGAVSNHRWYRKTFPGYPAERKTIIPFVY